MSIESVALYILGALTLIGGVYAIFFYKGPPYTDFHSPDPDYPLNKPRIYGSILLITGILFIYSATTVPTVERILMFLFYGIVGTAVLLLPLSLLNLLLSWKSARKHIWFTYTVSALTSFGLAGGMLFSLGQAKKSVLPTLADLSSLVVGSGAYFIGLLIVSILVIPGFIIGRLVLRLLDRYVQPRQYSYLIPIFIVLLTCWYIFVVHWMVTYKPPVHFEPYGKKVTVTGIVQCLQRKNREDMVLECTHGIKTDDGHMYAFTDIDHTITQKLWHWERYTVTGYLSEDIPEDQLDATGTRKIPKSLPLNGMIEVISFSDPRATRPPDGICQKVPYKLAFKLPAGWTCGSIPDHFTMTMHKGDLAITISDRGAGLTGCPPGDKYDCRMKYIYNHGNVTISERLPYRTYSGSIDRPRLWPSLGPTVIFITYPDVLDRGLTEAEIKDITAIFDSMQILN